MEEDRLANIEERLDAAEQDLQRLRQNVHDIKNEQQVLSGQMSDVQKSVNALTEGMSDLKANSERMLNFVEGTDKVLGFCRKHWRDLLKFGCGIVTAYGITNPHVQRAIDFTGKFFGF